MTCPLCQLSADKLIYQTDTLAIIVVDDEPKAPAFCRVIWKSHIKEMTDLSPAQRSELMMWVCKTEAAMRQVLKPEKINLASLGNQVPHLHWHVIARFANDCCFPDPIWTEAKREMPDLNLPDNWVAQVREVLESQM